MLRQAILNSLTNICCIYKDTSGVLFLTTNTSFYAKHTQKNWSTTRCINYECNKFRSFQSSFLICLGDSTASYSVSGIIRLSNIMFFDAEWSFTITSSFRLNNKMLLSHLIDIYKVNVSDIATPLTVTVHKNPRPISTNHQTPKVGIVHSDILM